MLSKLSCTTSKRSANLQKNIYLMILENVKQIRTVLGFQSTVALRKQMENGNASTSRQKNTCAQPDGGCVMTGYHQFPPYPAPAKKERVLLVKLSSDSQKSIYTP
jgi:hypothetical protein